MSFDPQPTAPSLESWSAKEAAQHAPLKRLLRHIGTEEDEVLCTLADAGEADYEALASYTGPPFENQKHLEMQLEFNRMMLNRSLRLRVHELLAERAGLERLWRRKNSGYVMLLREYRGKEEELGFAEWRELRTVLRVVCGVDVERGAKYRVKREKA
ncbi:hypothetical protein BJ508DRAFT_330894 [Ascobolus immersus RN42]|uniref:Uncharacterized protein n=1 Tax=Ascobolus immersus RN42 TaxID=1160509 RepID=A0A3N4HS25_ASCIM|nr:hypothetical protein BJ508DRAFT_330894 [Ascobolus immersus RN42]